MKRTSFNWVFREFISRKSPYALASRLGKSEKLIYAWAQDETSPFHRKDPLSLKEVEEAIYSLLLKKAELKKKLIEKAERERKPSQRR